MSHFDFCTLYSILKCESESQYWVDVLTSITSAASPVVTLCMASHIQLDGSLTELIGNVVFM